MTPQERVAGRQNRRQARPAARVTDEARLAFEVVIIVGLGAVTALTCVAGLGDITR